MGNDISAKSINEAIGTILAKLCYKAADELGQSFSEKTGEWRSGNAVAILQEANDKYEHLSASGHEHAHPSLVPNIVEEGSWSDDKQVQSMWAGLLASSCSNSGTDESNLIFINILKQLTSLEVTIINHACEKSKKYVSEAGWIGSDSFFVELSDL